MTAATATATDPSATATDGTTAPADTGTTDAPTTDGPADSSGPTTDATETGPSDTTGSSAGACDPVDGDTPCDMCVKGMCCDQLTACDADPDCVCFQDCAGSMPPSIEIPNICGAMCGIDTPFAHPTVGMVLSCSAGCLADCGL